MSMPCRCGRIFPLGLFLTGLLCAMNVAESQTISDARALFEKPTRDYSTSPLWVWNDRLTEEQVLSALRSLAAQDVKQVFVHPRPGLMTPYLSDEWFALWDAVLREAEVLDMNVWIYDENSYPSGFAGGLVPETMPESRGLGVELKEATTVPAWSDMIVAVYNFDGTTSTAITEEVKEGKTFPEGRYLVASLRLAPKGPWFGGTNYVDLLRPGVTEKFLELTLGTYRDRIGAQFGKRVPGSFTDEPHLSPAGGYHWTPDLPEVFRARWGYDLVDALPSLVTQTGNWKRVRHNYFQTLADLFVERWAKPYHDYCVANNLEFTGHYWEHEWPKAIVAPDNMANYVWHQRPAIDTLFNQYSEGPQAQFGNVRAVVELASVANQMGRERTLCEAYGGGGWDLRFEDMKRIADWLTVLGVNTIDEHLSHMTLRGERKHDYPQTFSYHEPWWDDYHVMARYITRLCVAMSQGKQLNRVLIIEPTTTTWMYQADGDGDTRNGIGREFQTLVTDLAKAQVEFDIGSENVMRGRSSVDSGKLTVGERTYDVVIVPPKTENLNAETVELLDRYLFQGGTVLSCSEPAPSMVDGQVSDRAARLKTYTNWNTVAVETVADELPKYVTSDGFEIRRNDGDKGILYHQRRKLDDGELLLLVNTSDTEHSRGAFSTGASVVEEWNLYDGTRMRRAPWDLGKASVVDFDLPPCGSQLFVLLANAQDEATVPRDARAGVVVPLAGELGIARRSPNVLTLDYVDLSVGGTTVEKQYFYPAQQRIFAAIGLEHNPWDSAVQHRDEFIAMKLPEDTSFDVAYRFTIDGAVPADLSVVIERADMYAVTCNGQPIAPTADSWWLDKAFARIDIHSVAKTGENVIALHAAPINIMHELQPAYIIGDFSVVPAANGFVIQPTAPIALGPWKAQGLALYGHDVGYTQHVTIEQPKGRYVVEVPSWYGSVAKVFVNGELAGHIVSRPWECDVTARIKPGDNVIEVVVIGTLKNTLGPHHGNPPLGIASPGSFRNAPEVGPPSGDAYSTIAYGLFEPFVVWQIAD